ncbi:hypothetical protein [Streptomyces sp. 1222.5]|uniref:hypothetical protein n=1 Tax=Streptomyces sp. 1222.5 TaxID=1881026 RepID=UPI003D70DD71
MTPSLDPSTMQRLAYIRFLSEEGAEYARRPHPLSCTAVLMIHDAVENFLGLATDHHGTNPDPKIQFMQYWSELKTKAQIDLPGRGTMTGLNAARVALKHHGKFPSEQTISDAVRDSLRFFAAASPIVFGVDFDGMDMVDLLTQPETQQMLRDAQTHADVGDYAMAMAGLALAFEALLRHYANWEGIGYRSPFTFGPRLFGTDEPKVHGREARSNARLLKLTEFMDTAQDALRVISLGIDYPSLARFTVLVPKIHWYVNGGKRFDNLPSVSGLTAEDYRWSRHFVIESALRAARADEIRGLRERAYELDRGRFGQVEERAWTGPREVTSEEGPTSEAAM